jgi:hypothetical protein
MPANGLQYQTGKNRQTTKNAPMPFLPPVSGASAFSNYSTNTGQSTSTVKKVKNYIFLLNEERPVSKISSRLRSKTTAP